ncbi:ribonuclease H-like domain-containing protein [Tanacetum coccineum]|uniref:Ribonuclease H-like domain-containing protein n=1 Tax=Tanacetum coccineum TaxID=301880 RepID=A0ABQ5DZL4_9ASTR
MSEPMPTLPTQSPFTYPNPNSSASPSFTQDDTFMPNPSASPLFTQDDTFMHNMPEPIQPMPTFTQTAFSQPVVHTQHTHPAQTNSTEKEKYEIWAMKMEYWIQNADHNLWRIVQQGNSPKRLGKDAKGNTIVHPPVSLDEHVVVQRDNKVRTLLLQALPEDHMPDFHHYDDARDIWMAVKARFEDFESVESSAQGKADNDDIKPEVSSLELDVRIGHSYGVKVAVAPTHSAFQLTCIALAQSLLILISQRIVPSVSQTSGRSDNFEKKAGRKMNYNNQQPARFDRRKVRCYKCLQLGHFARECNVKTVDDKARKQTGEVRKHKKEKKEWEVKFEATLARFEKWKESSKNLEKLRNSSMSTRTKIGLGFQEFVKAGEIMSSSSYNWTLYAQPKTKSEIEETHRKFANISTAGGNQILLLIETTTSILQIRPHPAGMGLETPALFLLLGRRDTAVKTSAGFFFLGNPSTDNDIVIVDMVAKNMTGNKEKLDDFCADQGSNLSNLPVEMNKVLFTDTGFVWCFPEEVQILMHVRWYSEFLVKHDLYTFHISDLQPEQKVTCLVAKASLDESTIWHEGKNFGSCELQTIIKLLRKGCDNGTEFKNAKLIELCGEKGIKRDYSNPRTPQQNGVAERKIGLLIELLEPVGDLNYLPGTQAGTQDHDSDSEVDEQVIVGTSFHLKQFYFHVLLNTMVLVLWNIMLRLMQKSFAKLQRQEYEAKDACLHLRN